MEFEVEIKVGSIQFLVNGGTDDGCLDFIDKVSVWDGKNYREIEFDSEVFIKYYGEQIEEAVDEQEMTNKICNAEMRYDSMKEEGLL